MEAAIDAGLTDIGTQREQLVSALPKALVGRYEHVRAKLGVAAAMLTGSQCEGCHLDLSPAEVDEVRPRLDAVAINYPEATLQDRTEYKETIEGEIDTLLVTVNALVGFAVIIAVLGIVNTLMLSVFERTKEIGLLRAVGMTRRQTRRMIRWEAVIIAVFGGVLGILVGILLGFIAVQAMPESFITDFGIPLGNFVVILIMCIVAGVLAAILPARRAARLNVLDAIAHS